MIGQKQVAISGKNALITGGAGFIGSHVCDKLIERDVASLTIVDDFSLGKLRNIEHIRRKSNVYNLDASDYTQMNRLMKDLKIDTVFNLAIHPQLESLVFPKELIEKNIAITTAMCELLRQKAFKTLIHCSSASVYGNASHVPMDESHPIMPLNPYAASKMACDQVVLSYINAFGIDASIVRPFNTFGPRQNEGFYAGVIPTSIKRILSGKSPIILGDGLQTRDYIYVEDTAEAVIRAFEYPSSRGKVINIASGRELKIKYIVEEIAKIMGYQGRIEYSPLATDGIRRRVGGISLLKEVLDYAPQTDFEMGLKNTVEWYKEVMKQTVRI